MPIERRWLKVSETAEYLGMNAKSVYRSCSARLIPHCKIRGVGIRIDKHELDQLLERRGVGPEEYGVGLGFKPSDIEKLVTKGRRSKRDVPAIHWGDKNEAAK